MDKKAVPKLFIGTATRFDDGKANFYRYKQRPGGYGLDDEPIIFTAASTTNSIGRFACFLHRKLQYIIVCDLHSGVAKYVN